MSIHLIHGIHTAGSDQAPEYLIQYLPGTVYYPDYGYELALTTRLINPMIVGTIEPYVAPGDTLIGHSNGCAIALELVERGAPVDGLVFINAALNAQVKLPDRILWCDIYFNAGDTVTEAAKVAAALGLVDTTWGEMGHSGYSGRDARVTNINCGATAGLPAVSGHSDIFSSRCLFGFCQSRMDSVW